MLAVPENDDDLVSSPSIESPSVVVVNPVDPSMKSATPPPLPNSAIIESPSPQQHRSRLSLFHRNLTATTPNSTENTSESP